MGYGRVWVIWVMGYLGYGLRGSRPVDLWSMVDDQTKIT